VVGGGYDLRGAEYFQPSFFDAFECLRAGDLMDEMLVDIQYDGPPSMVRTTC